MGVGGATTLGHYRLLRPIAQGGMAEVFLAERRSQGGVARFVALKRLLPHLSKQPAFVAMFLDEARLAARLMHQNIVQIVDFGVIDGQFFLAMEYLTGEAVHTVVRRVTQRGEQMPPGIALSIASQVCDGLHYAHTFTNQGVPLQVVHRDISPTNIFLTFQGGVKIIDFGIARAADRLQDSTGDGTFKGKVAYSSPEQLSSEELDARSDVFSVAVVLHELLSGQRLFRRDTELATYSAVMSDPAPSVRAIRPDLPEGIDEVLARALARKRDERYPSAMAFRRDLDALMPTSPPRLDDWLEHLFGRDYIARALDVESQRRSFSPPPMARLATPAGRVPEPPTAPGAGPPTHRRGVLSIVVAAVVLAAIGGVTWQVLATRDALLEATPATRAVSAEGNGVTPEPPAEAPTPTEAAAPPAEAPGPDEPTTPPDATATPEPMASPEPPATEPEPTGAGDTAPSAVAGPAKSKPTPPKPTPPRPAPTKPAPTKPKPHPQVSENPLTL